MHKGRYRNSRGGFRGGKARGAGGGNATAGRLKGLFNNGIWYCNCTPRMPGEHFKVKKEGPNKDRWFYTCQQPSESHNRCDFFLWDEDAKLREASAVLNNSRSEPRDPNVQEDWNAGRDGLGKMVSFSSSAKDTSPTPTPVPSYPKLPNAKVGLKRNASEAQLGDGEDEFDLSAQEEDEIFKAMGDISAFETPNKAQKTGVYATPATSEAKKSPRKLPWLQEQSMLATPVSSRKTVLDFFNSSPSKTYNMSTSTAHSTEPKTPLVPSAVLAPLESPSPSRYKNALHNPADSQSSLTNEVLKELNTVKLPPEKLDSLRSILSKHDLRTQGVTKGRDILRLAIKAKEAKIAELEATITNLKAEKEVDRSVIARLKWRQDSLQVADDEETDDEL